MISHTHKFIYTRVAKTGSEALLQALRNHVNDIDRVCDIASCDYDPNHVSSFDLKKVVPTQFDQYFKWAVTRNPWDRLVSIWSMNKQSNHFRCALPRYVPDFSEFIKSLDNLDWMPEKKIYHKCNKKYFNYTFGNVSDFTKGSDFIGKFENLQNDFDFICDTIGIPRHVLPTVNTTQHLHYSEYYNDETRQIVAERYAKDLERFDYTFD
jgi:chondroitin 4-sulfotransferase 11